MADNDFERVCEAYWNEISGGACWSLHGERVYGSDREFVRRGMAAALREIRHPSGAMQDAACRVNPPTDITVWQAMIDALLAQAEDREAAQ